jgi:hypothetical protein
MPATARNLALTLALMAGVTSCAPLGNLGGLGDVFGGNSVYGEVRSVDTRRGRIQLREQQGRDYTVRYDNRTRVVYQNRQYPVSALERGDQVQVSIQYDRNDDPWAERIDLRSSARSNDRDRDRRDDDRDRDDVWSDRVQRLDGRVQSIDTRRGYFTMTQNNYRVTVYMPRDARREDIRRFERLRRGERVRADVRNRGSQNQAELVRFR